MINRRLIIILAAALTLIVLLNGAWYYGYPDNQLNGLTDNTGKTNGPPSTESKLHNDASSEGHEHPQPELPPKLDPQDEADQFDHGTQDAANKDEPDNSDKLKAPGTTEKGSGETSVTRPGSTGSIDGTPVDWSRYAYVQYVTAPEHVCNSVMVFESLHRLGSKADRVLLYPEQWGEVGSSKWKMVDATTAGILLKAKDEYNVKLKPIDLISKKGQERTWEAGFTKLLAFNESYYDRTIMFDNDATVLKHLDHLFLLPPTPLAIPRAYWLFPDPLPEKTIHKYILSAQLLVVTPNQVVFNAMLDAIKTKGTNDYDMEIINWVLGSEAMVLPHRALNLLSGEFRQEHTPGQKGYNRYLGLTGEVWDAKKVLDEAYYVHFSDYPRPKPWYHPHEDKMPELLPKCYPKIPAVSGYDSRRSRRLRRNDQEMDCSDKETWLWLYSDFKDRRKNICGLDLSRPPY